MDKLKPCTIFIDARDKNGTEIHVGDTLRFNAEEWWGLVDAPDYEFIVEIKGGEILIAGSPDDLEEYCEVIECPHQEVD